MSKQKHTPGPWDAWLPGRKFVIPRRNFDAVCELNQFERDPETVTANAHLIAAAPDLLEACKATVAAYESGQLYDKCPMSLLRAAIAKAEGNVLDLP